MWALDKDSEEVIKSAWHEANDVLNVAAVEKKLVASAKALSLWNSSSFGQLQRKIKSLEFSPWGVEDIH